MPSKPRAARLGRVTNVITTAHNTKRVTIHLDNHYFHTSAHLDQQPVPTLPDQTPVVTKVPGMNSTVCQFEVDPEQHIDDTKPFLVVHHPLTTLAIVYNDPEAGSANLPFALNIFCLTENRARPFGRKYASIYECPCGQFAWDVLAWEK